MGTNGLERSHLCVMLGCSLFNLQERIKLEEFELEQERLHAEERINLDLKLQAQKQKEKEAKTHIIT